MRLDGRVTEALVVSREVVDWKARPTSALGPPLCALLSSSRYLSCYQQ